MAFEEKTVSVKHIYKGGIIELENHVVSLPDGTKSTRDIVLHPGGAVVIPINEDGELYMVRQYRKPIEMELLELPAGKLDPGEEPLVCAKRELKEETGLTANKIQHFLSIHSTPGFSNEVLHMYLATELEVGEACADEGEFISCEKYKIEKLVEMIFNHEITDAKSIIGILAAERYINSPAKD